MSAAARSVVAALMLGTLAAGCGDVEGTSRPPKPRQDVQLTAATTSGLRVRVELFQRARRECGAIAALTSRGGPGGQQGQSNRICEPVKLGPAPAFVLVRAHSRRGAVLIVNDFQACDRLGSTLEQGRSGSTVCTKTARVTQALLAIDRNRRVGLRGLPGMRRFSASRYPCSAAQGVCFTELDRSGKPRG